MAIDPINTNHFSRENKSFKPIHEVREPRQRPSESSSATSQPHTQDVLRISSEQEEHDHLLNTIKQAPDIREEKVAKVKEFLKSGHYRISSEDLAARIIQDAILHSTRKSS
ncbi:MAG: hypothetical protein NPIRA05_04590 [Nitrospirales bacterium]|nr:MAG: hypothetical protein NPIRA05_04590 [Nitrospirales bacterium]